MELIKFGSDHIDNLVAQDPGRLDRLPFGAIMVDPSGRILKYNAFEAEASNHKAADVLGRNFFDDVAPCTKTHQFQGCFKDGVAKGAVNTMFEYAFDAVAPAKVRVHIKSIAPEEGVWIFIKRV